MEKKKLDNYKYEKMMTFIKPHLRDYLIEKGLLKRGCNSLRCIHRLNKNPEKRHVDSHASAHFTQDKEHIYCEGCKRVSDIHDIALMVEPKAPTAFKSSFVTTLEYLYRKYGGK